MRKTKFGLYPEAVLRALGTETMSVSALADRIGDTEWVVRNQLNRLHRDGQVTREKVVCNLGYGHGDAWKAVAVLAIAHETDIPTGSVSGPLPAPFVLPGEITWAEFVRRVETELDRQGLSREAPICWIHSGGTGPVVVRDSGEGDLQISA